MAYNKSAASFATLRSLAFGSIGASYANVGTVLTYPALVLKLSNACDTAMFVSTDGVNDMIYLPANSFTLYDIRTNSPSTADYMFSAGTQFMVKQVSAPSSGSVYLEVIQATPG